MRFSELFKFRSAKKIDPEIDSRTVDNTDTGLKTHPNSSIPLAKTVERMQQLRKTHSTPGKRVIFLTFLQNGKEVNDRNTLATTELCFRSKKETGRISFTRSLNKYQSPTYPTTPRNQHALLPNQSPYSTSSLVTKGKAKFPLQSETKLTSHEAARLLSHTVINAVSRLSRRQRNSEREQRPAEQSRAGLIAVRQKPNAVMRTAEKGDGEL